MKTLHMLPILVVLMALVPGPCYAAWSLGPISKEHATKLGMEVRSREIGQNKVSVELQIKTTDALKNLSRVELQIKKDDTVLVSAALKEDRTKPGYITVQFAGDPAQLDTIMLRVWIYQGRGGVIHELPMHEFVEVK